MSLVMMFTHMSYTLKEKEEKESPLQIVFAKLFRSISVDLGVLSEVTYKIQNTNNLFPPISSDTVMFIYDNYDNKYDNTMSYSCLLLKND